MYQIIFHSIICLFLLGQAIFFLVQLIKHREEFKQSIKIAGKILTSKDFWKYVASMEWLFRKIDKEK